MERNCQLTYWWIQKDCIVNLGGFTILETNMYWRQSLHYCCNLFPQILLLFIQKRATGQMDLTLPFPSFSTSAHISLGGTWTVVFCCTLILFVAIYVCYVTENTDCKKNYKSMIAVMLKVWKCEIRMLVFCTASSIPGWLLYILALRLFLIGSTGDYLRTLSFC